MYSCTGNKPYFGFLKDFVCLLILTGETYKIIAILMLQKMRGQWEECTCYILNVCVFNFLTNYLIAFQIKAVRVQFVKQSMKWVTKMVFLSTLKQNHITFCKFYYYFKLFLPSFFMLPTFPVCIYFMPEWYNFLICAKPNFHKGVN